MSVVAGIVLAAGLSQRMGRPKQLLAYREGTMLDAVVAAAEASRLDPVVVVLGAASVEVEATLRRERATLVRNLRYHDGNMSSLLTGIAAVGDHDAVIVLLGDMPDIDAVLIDHMVDRWLADRRPLGITRYEDGEGHPLVLSSAVTGALGSAAGPKALWKMIHEAPPRDVLGVPVARPRPLDVDTPEDYARLLQEPL